MNFNELVRQRYSCRKYKQELPSREVLEDLIKTASYAPSAKNLQPWKYIVIDEPNLLETLKAAYPREWISSAPAIIVICGDYENAWHRQADGKVHTDIDVAITVDHLTLAATNEGLATCWICMFDPKEVKQILQIPDPWDAVVMLPIGFPEDQTSIERHDRLRKPLEESVSYNKW